MARGDLACPLDGTVLGLPNPALKQGIDLQKDAAPGGHVHLDIDVTFTCSQGHQWRIKDSLIMEKVA